MPKTAEIAGDILIQTALQNKRAPKKRLFGVVIRWSKGVILQKFSKASWDRINMAAAVFKFQKRETQSFTHFIHFLS